VSRVSGERRREAAAARVSHRVEGMACRERARDSRILVAGLDDAEHQYAWFACHAGLHNEDRPARDR